MTTIKGLGSSKFSLKPSNQTDLGSPSTWPVWNVNPDKLGSGKLGDFDPDIAVRHNNDTGAYVSVFKATWSSNPNVDPFFTIGNMKRNLDVYTKDGSLIRSLGEDLSSVPAVTCGHPSKPVIFGGAAGGGSLFSALIDAVLLTAFSCLQNRVHAKVLFASFCRLSLACRA